MELFIFGRFHARQGERHAGLPHTVRFIERVQTLTDQPIEVTRAHPIA